MKTIFMLIFAMALCITNFAMAQEEDSLSLWKTTLNMGVNINQASFSDNWKAGGVNSIGVNTFLNFRAVYEKDKISWDNAVELLYGFVNLSDQNPSFRKTNDRIFLDSKVGYKLSETWDLFGSLNFQTQWADGFRYERGTGDRDEEILISGFFAPAFLTTAWGLQYEPAKFFRLRLAPFSPRITIVNNADIIANVPENYGVAPGETVRYEWLAFQMMADFDKDIAENLNLKFRYFMFANYETLAFKTIDHRLDLSMTAKVNKFLNVNLTAIMLYDIDQDKDIQFSQALSVGFAYTFKNHKD
ncbi:MAG: DUF3078 domain-containing protein [Cyclobacteriaceae bacterium]|nr:DUF3078 domain-containing protein [Cyclobacteriaceae bacterium]